MVPPLRRLRPTLTRVLVAVGCAGALLAAPAAPAAAQDTGTPPQVCRTWGDRAACQWAADLLDRMTIEEKVGQLFVSYAYGDSADTTNPADVAANRATFGVDNAAALIAKYHLGGMIYFAWSNNVNNPPQIAHLSNGIQQAAAAMRVPVPMLISTDQEQGLVSRIGPPFTQFPGNMALGAGRSLYDTDAAASVTGTELKALGINRNFAPVADVNVNPANPVIGVRSFGSDPGLVARLTGAAVRGYQQSGVSATAKHFPGHGDTGVDSHTGIPVITHTEQQWSELDRPPFQSAIDAGIDSIMTAHIIVPSLDPSGDPATLSHPIITGVLRDQLRFDGVVITDALDMAGVRAKYGDDRVPVLALKAGVDELLMPPKFDLAYTSVLAAVRSGEISEARIDESVLRVLRMKYERGLAGGAMVDESAVPSVVGTPEHWATANEVTNHTTTLIRNEGGVLPLAAGSGRHVLVTGWGVSTTASLGAGFTKRGLPARVLETGITPTQAKIDAAVAAAGSSDLVVVTTNRAWASPEQQRLVRALQATGKPVMVLAVRDPYDIAYFPDVAGYLATYSYTGVALDAVLRVLFGEVDPTGRLPVSIPAAGAPGTTLYPYGFGLSYHG